MNKTRSKELQPREGVVLKNWVPADQIPAVVEAQLDDDVLPCGCPVDPLEIEDARASLIEEARVAACDDRDDVCEILEAGDRKVKKQ